MFILRAGDFETLPWKNGLGVSRVIASHPARAGYDAVHWQVGTTEIGADCPFSSLPGMDRRFMLLEGAGVELACSDAAEGVNLRHAVDTPFVPFAFRGDWKTQCRLLGSTAAGRVKVLNVMTERTRAAATVEVLDVAHAATLVQKPGETLLAVVLLGELGVGDRPATSSPYETARLDAPEGESCAVRTVSPVVRLAVVRLTIC